MPSYDYKCKTCGKIKTFFLSMGHHKEGNIPICEEESCPKDEEMERQYGSVYFFLKGGGWTEKTSATKEKNAKLKKLYNDSYVGMDNYDKAPLEDRKKKEAEEE